MCQRTLLFSLEAIPGLQWDKLQSVRSKDGSYLFCPSSTAFAFNQSKDPHCFAYLNNVAQSFNGGGGVSCVHIPIDLKHKSLLIDHLNDNGEVNLLNMSSIAVPDFYPVEFFEKLWIVDRLERLGIARYFQPQIKDILDYVHRYN